MIEALSEEGSKRFYSSDEGQKAAKPENLYSGASPYDAGEETS